MAQLEDRSTPAVITVTTLADTVAVDGVVSLREAIQSMNASANINADVNGGSYGGFDQIRFTGLSGTITLTSNMDPITRGYAISGSTGAGFAGKPVITIDGASQFTPFIITGPDVVIANLSIVRSSAAGVLITGAGATRAEVRENHIGLDAAGTTVKRNQVGGVKIANGATMSLVTTNAISGNTGSQISIQGSGTSSNVIVNNIIGLAADGTLLPQAVTGNGVTISDGASNNRVGGTDPSSRNIIGRNDAGVLINKFAFNNTVQGNLIGLNQHGVDARNTEGVVISSAAANNLIGGTTPGAWNIIAFNNRAGVVVTPGFVEGPAVRNAILTNSIFSNGGLGIDHGFNGVTANDNQDADTGPNGFQNYPVIQSAVGAQAFGFLQSEPNTTFRLEFFSNDARNASGFGEGQRFVGTINVTTDASGNAPFTFTAATDLTGKYVSGTATRIVSNTPTETSEFSNAVLGLPVPIATPTPTPLPRPNPIPTATPPAIPILIPQLIPGTTILAPILLPSSLPTGNTQLPPNPVKNTPLTPAGVTPTFSAGQIAATAGAAVQPKAGLVVGAGLNGHSIVAVYNGDGTLRGQLTAFPNFLGGVRLGTGDVNNDGHPDILAAAGVGGQPHVKVFSGVDGSLLRSFYAYDTAFTGGVFVAGGDVNGDGFAEVITGAGAGGRSHVKVFDGATGAELAGFYAYDPAFTGGVSVAAADVNNDGLADVVTGAGAGGGPHVKVVEGTSLNQVAANGVIADSALLASFFAFAPSFTGGVFISAGADFNGDGIADIVLGAGAGGGPHVKVVDGALLATAGLDGAVGGAAVLDSFYAFDQTFTGGVRVGEADATQDGQTEVILGAGPGGGPAVQVRRAGTFADLRDFYAFVPEYAGGVFVD